MTIYGDIGHAISGTRYGWKQTTESPIAMETIEFGRPVFGYIGVDNKVWGFKKDTAKLVFSADFVALNSIVVTVNGVATSAVVFTTDHATTAGLVVNALNALDGVEAVLDSSDATNRTYLIRVQGETAVASAVVTLGASQATASATYFSGQVFKGIASRAEKSYIGVAAYEQGDPVDVIVRGSLYCDCTTAAQSGAAVYVGSDGKVANTGTDIGCRFQSTITLAGLVIVKIDSIEKNLTYATSF